MTAGQRTVADVSALLRARNSLLWVVTREEARVEQALVDAAAAAGYETRLWDCTTGVSDAAGKAVDDSILDPQAALAAVRSSEQRQVWVLRDFHAWLRDPTVLRGLRSLVKALAGTPRDQARAVVVLTPSAEVPPELAGHAVVLDWPLPDREEMALLLDATVAAQPAAVAQGALQNGSRDAAIDAAVGLTAHEAESTFARSIVTTRRIDPAVVAAEKRRVINRERVLEWYDPDPRGLDAVGGLDVLKAWLVQRRTALSQRAREFGLPAPKGVLLVGVPGCGKSLTAKAVAAAWRVPLLRLDLGALRSKWIGESEGNLRKALKVAETVAPCILWLDEVEKAFAGATQGAADGGVAADALGAVLSWLQERAGAVFVVATANDVRALPPELLRKGRFDEVFFVDLPTVNERAVVLAATMKQHGRDPSTVDLAAVSACCAMFTGAEMAALVPDALFTAFADGERPITTEDLARAASSVVPLAKTASEKVKQLREWATGRARPASTPVTEAAPASRQLDL